ncbi:hypothetical protein [Cohnella yongneupensis]|uniref:Nucleotidyltransferase AbiEii toxin of type IV toxin-antitoxin system n=1 Tax=Cohnella yongneupensis TaxID=425006 RepID=A0ABW0QW75_9BACL
MNQKIENLLAVTKRLEKSEIPYALGGSGLLLSFDLTNTVRDWDITTNASIEDVLNSLSGLHIEEITSGDYPFASSFKLLIHENDPQVELIGDFTIQTDNGICKIPTIPDSRWEGVKVGSPEAWYVAYSLMERIEKANLLLSYLKNNGANALTIEKLVEEPLPDVVVKNLYSLLK